ncbi:tyrosine-type recombinase/integrase [Peribacillus frigoritolerans]|uniref:tyrosine-type recombinase/integrase n=1 Tax=Peribacillus castrilensis TaxID=2897690 RepID=UPI002DCB375D|nr:tyrosine-type recombinase/integrase [Peribacillus castrilensis]
MVIVREVVIPSGEKRWIVLANEIEPVIPIMKYIKYLDSLGKAPNTLKSYCYHLKLYWEFLLSHDKSYKEVDLNLLASFIGWLRMPQQNGKVKYLYGEKAKRRERSINIIVSCVINFYDYLMRLDGFEKDLKTKVMKEIKVHKHSYKSFLNHISDKQLQTMNVLKVKEPRRKIKTVTEEQITQIQKACKTIRDQLIIRIMYEGGLRASEVINLWIEDFNINDHSILVRKSKTVAGENRKVYVSKETMNVFQDYIIDYHTDEVDTNFVFFNLSGKNKGKPIQYWTIQSLMRRIGKKTGIDFSAHMLRHTCATNLHEHGMDASSIQKFLGHAYVQTTLQMYVHPSDETIRKNWESAMKKQIGDLYDN